MGTLNNSEKAATFVALSLLAGIATGIWSFFDFVKTNAVRLLIACVLITLFLIVASVYIVVKLHRATQALEKYGVPPTGLTRLLSLRQWLTLTIGLAVIAVATGSLTGVDIMTRPAASVAATGPTATPVPTTISSTTQAPTPTPTPTMSPSDSSASPLPSDSSPSGDASGSPTPAPGATTFLDSQPTTDGGYDSGPVTFSGKRYLRGISRWCQGMTVSRVQWNVANSVRFSAVVGISDGTTRAYGIAVDMLFYDQDGHQLTPQPIEASVGHPVPVTIPLTGVVTLRLVCSARYVQTNQQTSVYAALGDPVIVEQ